MKLSGKNMLGYVLIVDLDLIFFSWGLLVANKNVRLGSIDRSVIHVAQFLQYELC